MKRVWMLVCLLLFAHAFAAEQADLSARFIGNAAFRITDGKTVLLTDFPYTSGAFGYMKYDASEVKQEPDALCLITHAHADHWNAELFQKMNASLIAPPKILKTVKSATNIEF